MIENSDEWHELKSQLKELIEAARALTECGIGHLDDITELSTTSDLLLEAPSNSQLARRKVAAILGRLQSSVSEPGDFIQRLAHHIQLLACLQWLGEFQVLACIPLSGSVAAREVADLADVSETQLTRIVRMTATASFLDEPQPGHISHTPLSAPFVSNLSYLDATMLLAKIAAPAALAMTAATQHCMDGHSDRPGASAYSLAFDTKQGFQSACEQQPRLHRQWLAYLRYTGVENEGTIELLSGLGWFSVSSACIVNIGAHSTATANTLARLNPTLQLIIQLTNTGSTKGATSQHLSVQNLSGTDGDGDNLSRRIKVQYRAPASPQTVKDAAVYILNLPTLSTAIGGDCLRSQIVAELRAHAEILRVNTSATLILLSDLLSESKGVDDRDVKATAYFRDLSLWQMTNGWGIDLAELVDLVNGMQDGMGQLIISDKLRLRNGAIVALYVKYQSKWGF